MIEIQAELPEYCVADNIAVSEPLWGYFKLKDVFEIINNNFKLGDIELKAVLGNRRNRNKHLSTWSEIQKNYIL